MNVSTYLFFNGRCEEAVDYYKQTLGADVEMLMRFADAPDGYEPPGMPDAMKSKVMHVAFNVGDTSIMASDGMCNGESRPSFDGFSLSISVPDVASAEKVFDALAADGTVSQPLIETFFSPRFGIVADKFGVSWMIVAQPTAS